MDWVNRADRQAEINEVIKMDPILKQQKSRKKIAPQFLPMIPLLNDILNRKRGVSIIDFGGGMGEHFQMTYWYPEEARKLIKYYVIEVPENCVAGKQINFLSEGIQYIPNQLDLNGECTYNWRLIGNKCDIVMLCGALQYFKSWQSLLKKLSVHAPKYFYITRTLITDSPTFYVCQSTYLKNNIDEYKYMGDSVHTVFNLHDIVVAMKNLKYDLALDLLLSSYELKLKDYSGEYGRTEYHSLIFKIAE